MVTHYFTLQALLKGFQSALTGSTIREIFTQRKDELVISFGSTSLVVSIHPLLNFVVLREPVTRARKNSVDLFQDIAGASVDSFDLLPSDRTYQCMMNNGLSLYLQLYNSASSNIILADNNDTIVETFKGNKERRGKQWNIESKESDPRLYQDEKLFAQALQSDSQRTTIAALKQTIPILGTQYAKEVLFRADIDADLLTEHLSADQTTILRKKLTDLFLSLEHPLPVIYSPENGRKIFSVAPMLSLGGCESHSYTDTNSAVLAFLTSSFRAKGNDTEKKEILQKLEAESRRVQRSLAAVANQLKEGGRADEYEHKGKLILANITGVSKGLRVLTVVDFSATSSRVTIELNPLLSPSKNAEHYFEKAKKSRVALKETAERQSGLDRSLKLTEQMIRDLQLAEEEGEIKEFRKKYQKDLLAMKIISPPKGEELPPFRIFTVAGDYQVWVGKSSANNDLLTMKYAKPNDLWFHVRGSSGSHTVLKVKSGAETPKEAVRQAAAIAAYYSKMRNAGNVPVAYCERKYVRKPKGLAQGAVFLEREKTIFVKPGLP